MTASTARLSKHHGLGNDFLVWVDGNVERGGSLAQTWCDRRRGIGADGLLIAHAEGPGRWRMVLFNADGSRAEMSGNGIRCFVQAVTHGVPGVYSVSTDAGVTWSPWRTVATPGLSGCAATGPALRGPQGEVGFAFESFKEFDDPAPARP